MKIKCPNCDSYFKYDPELKDETSKGGNKEVKKGKEDDDKTNRLEEMYERRKH